MTQDLQKTIRQIFPHISAPEKRNSKTEQKETKNNDHCITNSHYQKEETSHLQACTHDHKAGT